MMNFPTPSPRPGQSRRTQNTLVFAAVFIPLLLLFALFNAALAGAAVPPTLDLNGDLAGYDYAVTFTEDEGAEVIVNPTGLLVADSDSPTLVSATVTLTAAPDGLAESLSADAGATGIIVKPKQGGHTLELSGTKSLLDYQQVLRTVAYLNTSQGPDTSDRFAVFQLYDGTEKSIPVTSTISINAVNDAPLLDNTGSLILSDINENVFNSLGNKVETILASGGGDPITDPDAGALEGMAVIEAGSGNGSWQYSLDAGTNWLNFENVSNQTATLLNPAARIRFVPKPQFSGSAAISFRAWDQTQGLNGDKGVDVTKNGGTTAFSLNTETATINILSADDPPVVDLNGPDAGADYSAGYLGSNVPIPVADSDATITDPDSQMLTSATLRLTNRPDGNLEVLAASVLSTSITIVPFDLATGELVLNGPDTVEAFQQVLRTATYVNAALVPKSGTRIVEVTANDGTSMSNVVTTTIQINPDNHAPILSIPGGIALGSLPEDTLDPPGTSVEAMLASVGGNPITDPDPGALRGFALTAADNSHGAWQFAVLLPPAGTPAWEPVGVVSDTAALLLNTGALLRFVPAANYVGPSGNLTFRAWDQTSGVNGQRNVDVTLNGGSSAFSEQTAVASVIITPVNDAPIITFTPATPPVYEEDSSPLPVLNDSLAVSDVDNVNLASATVTLLNRPNGDAELLDVLAAGTGLSVLYDSGVLTISGPAALSTYRQVLRSLTYHNTSQDPDVTDRQIQVVVSDGTATSNPLLVTVGVVATNDLPIVDLNGAGPGVDVSTDFYIRWRPARLADPNSVLIDLDDTSIISATVQITNLLDGTAESLAARVAGTNIKQAYDPAAGLLLLSGIDSVANYQRVLRSVTYNNTLAAPTPTVRTIEFRAQDAQDLGPVSRAMVSIQPTPTAYIFMPTVIRTSEEPNDKCHQAPATPLNRDESYFADDAYDWFYFDLPAAAQVTVQLTNFVEGKGQLIVATGPSCDALERLGNNGDPKANKTVDIGRRPAGRYYIWIIADEPPNPPTPYTLRVITTP